MPELNAMAASAMSQPSGPSVMPESPLSPKNVQVKTPDEILVERDADQAQIDILNAARANELKTKLPGVLFGFFTQAKMAKITSNSGGMSVVNELLEDERQRRGEYSPDKLAALQGQQGSKAFIPVTDQKCCEAISWLRDIYGQSEDKPFILEPHDEPELSDEVKAICRERTVEWAQNMIEQMGGTPPSGELLESFKVSMHDNLMAMMKLQGWNAAVRMETKIHRQLQSAGWSKEFDKFIDDLTTFPYAIMKIGLEMRDQLSYAMQKDGSWKQVVRDGQPTYFVKRVSPFDIFFSPRMTDMDHGYMFERIKCSRADIIAMKGLPGYKDSEIDAALKEFGSSGYYEWIDMEWSKLIMENKIYNPVTDSSDIHMDTLEFHGSVQGRLLKDWGVKKAGDDDIEDQGEYEITAIMIATHVIKVVIERDIRMRPYFTTNFYKLPDTLYGKGIAQKMRTEQNFVNLCHRAIENNTAMSSGPQAIIDTRFMSGKENYSDFHPYKIWHVQSKDGQQGKPIDFFVPPNVSEALIKEMQYYLQRIDDVTDIPRYQSGSPNGAAGAMNTAKGLSILMAASSKSIKNVVKNIDNDVIIPIVEWLYRMNMLYDDDKYAKGALKVKVNGTFNMDTTEAQTQSLMGFLQIVLAPGSELKSILGRKGLAQLLRPLVKRLKLHDEHIIPTDDELDILDKIDKHNAQMQAQAQAQAQQAQANFQNQRAVSETTKRQTSAQAATNNSVAQGVISPQEARQALAQTSQMAQQTAQAQQQTQQQQQQLMQQIQSQLGPQQPQQGGR